MSRIPIWLSSANRKRQRVFLGCTRFESINSDSMVNGEKIQRLLQNHCKVSYLVRVDPEPDSRSKDGGDLVGHAAPPFSRQPMLAMGRKPSYTLDWRVSSPRSG
jgi:hypothetical protein